ncbi:MAG: RNA polymerase sigma factor [Acidimicrobiia bacterium]
MTIGEGFPQVLLAAQDGAKWAWQRLYTSVAAGVRGYVAAQGARDPDDLTGEVLLQLVRGIHRFSGDEAAFRSWVFVIAHHRVVDERRRAHRRQRLDARLPVAVDEVGGAEAEVLERSWPEEWAQRLDQLSDDQRTVVLLRVVAGLSAEEVGQVLGKKAGAVRVMQHRAIIRLQEICAAEVTP